MRILDHHNNRLGPTERVEQRPREREPIDPLQRGSVRRRRHEQLAHGAKRDRHRQRLASPDSERTRALPTLPATRAPTTSCRSPPRPRSRQTSPLPSAPPRPPRQAPPVQHHARAIGPRKPDRNRRKVKRHYCQANPGRYQSGPLRPVTRATPLPLPPRTGHIDPDNGQAGLIVVYATDMADQVAANIKAVNKYASKDSS